MSSARDQAVTFDGHGGGGSEAVTSGWLLLQGGAEMEPDCRDMDLRAISLAPAGDLVVVLGAATPGSDHDRATARARRYYEDLVPERRVVVAAHPELDLEGCLAAVGGAGVIVLPGGSPTRLLGGLMAQGGRLAQALTDRARDGVLVSGSSAGAMVLCARTALPEQRRLGGPRVVAGLGLAPGLAMVHDDGGDSGWRDPDEPDGLRWGLPEAGGVLLHEHTVHAVGQGSPRALRGDREVAVPREPVALDQVV